MLMDAQTRENDFTRLCELAETVGVQIMIRVAREVLRARQMHPELGCCPSEALKYIKSEMLGFEAQAMLAQRQGVLLDGERKSRSDEEALHVIAVLMRWIRCEFGGAA